MHGIRILRRDGAVRQELPVRHLLLPGAAGAFDPADCRSASGGNCGDGTIDAGEQCDSTSWGTVSGCSDFDSFTSGALSCAGDCQFDTSGCPGGSGASCGDGTIDAGEQCDSANWGTGDGGGG